MSAKCKCAELTAYYTESMEINAGSMATAGDWQGIDKVARLHCPVHGSAPMPARFVVSQAEEASP